MLTLRHICSAAAAAAITIATLPAAADAQRSGRQEGSSFSARSALAAPSSSTVTRSLPPSAIDAPAPRLAPLPPPSPSPGPVLESSGDSSRTGVGSAALSGASPSLSAPSAPGGGGETLQDCMNFWDAGTHMTRAEWRAACKRTMNRLRTFENQP